MAQATKLSIAEDDASYEELDTSDFVTFSLAEELFAFPMARVQEIIRVPQTVKVPLAPHSLEGLANLRGRVLPIVSLRSCTGYEAVQDDEATRVIVVDCGVPLGFVVDRVAAVISVEPDQVEDAATINATVDSKLLTGVIKSGEDKMIAILEVERLVDLEFRTITRNLLDQHDGVQDGAGEDSSEEESDDTLELVSFVVNGQEYSLPIDQVQEIVQAPETVTDVPNADARVVGVMDLRGRLLPVISLRRVFALEQGPLHESNRIIVVPLESDGARSTVGLLMDTVREVLRVPHALVDELPGYLAREGGVTEVESVCRLDEGKRLVSVLSTNRMFQRNGLHAAVDQLKTEQEDGTVDDERGTTADDEWNDDVEQLVVFRVDGEEYCLTVDAVQEIIRVPEQLIHVPRALDFVEGLVNLRGAVLPVVDLRARLRLDRAERDDLQRIVVLIVGGVRTGFVVDSVTEVLQLDVAAIERAPELSEEQARVISKVANLLDGQRMLLILEAEQLLGSDETEALTDHVAQAA